MAKTTLARGGTVAGVRQTVNQQTLLMGRHLIVHDGRIVFLDNAGGVEDVVLYRDSAGVLGIVGAWRLEGAASTTDVLTARVTGDTVAQLVINANGRIEWGSGSGAVDVALFRDGSLRLHTVNTFVTEGDLILDVAGKGLHVKEGANAKMGTLTLNGATEVTVSTTAVTATSRIFLTTNTVGGTATGRHWVTARTAGTSFGVSGVAGDTSVVAWMLVEPA